MANRPQVGESWAAFCERRATDCQQANQNRALNNLNSSNNYNLNPNRDIKLQAEPKNLNGLKGKGVSRIELYTDEALKKAMSWGVEEWLVQVCIRDYGLHTVKGQINRIYQLPDGYFKPQYGPINTQRGRIFNKEMQKLKQQRVKS
jgi:hypothetical protein